VPQTALECQKALLADRQELAKRGEQGRELLQEAIVVLELVEQLAAPAKALARLEAAAQIRLAAHQPVQRGKLLGTEATCKATARQPQRLPYAAHAHAGEPIECF
jgi:hypothetical protein